MRPSAPPLLFWKVSASTTCSRLTLPILVRTRPIGRPWSWSIGGMAVVEVDAAGRAPAGVVPPAGSFAPPGAAGLPPTPTGLAPVAGIVTFAAGRNPLDGLIGATGFLPGSGAAGPGVGVSVRDMAGPRLSLKWGNVVVRT